MKKPSTWIIIVLSVALFLALAENRSFSDERDRLKAEINELQQECEQQYEEGRQEGYDLGYDEGTLDGGTFYPVTYYEMDDMSDNEIIAYLKSRYSWATLDELIEIIWEPLIGE